MIKILTFLIVAILFGYMLFALSQNSGLITIDILNYQIETSLGVALISLLIGFIIVQIIIIILYKFFTLPSSIRTYLDEHSKKTRVKLLVNLLDAVAISDKPQVVKLASKLAKSNDYKSVASLLEVTHLPTDNFSLIKSRLERLMELPLYQPVILKQLFELHYHNNKIAEALAYIDCLLAIKKCSYSVERKLICLIKLGDWQAAHYFVKTNLKEYIALDKLNTIKAVINYKLAAVAMEIGDFIEAQRLSSTALKCDDGLYPIIHSLIQILVKLNALSKAEKLIKTYWPKFNNPIFTMLVLGLAKNYTAQEFYSVVKDITRSTPHYYESRLLFAKAALDNDQFDLAFKEISEAISEEKNLRACLLMAEFCQRTHGNNAEVLSWLKQALSSEFEICQVNFYLDFNSWKVTTYTVENGVEITKL